MTALNSNSLHTISARTHKNSSFPVLLLTLILVSLFPQQSVAKKIKYSDGRVNYTLDTSTKTATVTGVEDTYYSSDKVTILDFILNEEDGKSYKVTSIAKEAFRGAFLKEVNMPSTIETIGSYAFETCSLKKLELPANLKTVGAYAFNNAVCPKNPIELIIPTGCTAIKNSAFNGCKIRSIRFNKKLTTIGDYCFGNTNITEVDVPACVTSLGKGVFAMCEELTTATLRYSYTSLGEGMFSGCTNLSSVTLPSTITSIGIWAFKECSSLKTLTLPAALKSIGDYAFYKAGLEKIILPNGISTLGDHSFSYIPTLTEITIPASMRSIGAYSFYECNSLMTVNVPNPVPCELGTYGFGGQTYCEGILNIPAGSESAYRQDREWSCFHCLYDYITGVDEIPVTQAEQPRDVRKTDGGRVIEIREGEKVIRYNLSGARIK